MPRKKEIREIRNLIDQYGLSQTGFARRFNIPLRNVQHWCSLGNDRRDCPNYVIDLIKFALENDYNV